MPEQPTIDECLKWFNEITQWLHDKPEYQAIRAILEAMQKRGITLEDLQTREFEVWNTGHPLT